ncbi:MAG: ROK family transcriptional regulator [Actinomycetota bacterium]|nr:ROK family transcriptional regulator [Actinomycetota bacterium]
MSGLSGSAARPVDSQRMRQANLALVLGAVLDDRLVSQSSLVERTGLKKPTVSKLVEELHRFGWIRLEGEAQGTLGRPRQLWAPDPQRGLVVSAQISVDHMATLVVDFAGDIRTQRSVTIDLTGWSEDEAVEAVARMISGSLSDVEGAGGRDRPILGLALAVPGIVTERGELRYAPGLGWASPDIGAKLRQALAGALPASCPVLVENEANLATLAELRLASADGVRNLVYILGDRGVGAGVVLNGSLFRGAHRSGGEVGHVTIDLDGPRCPCGKRGCWAMYVGQEVLRRQALEARQEGRSSQLWGRDRPVDTLTSSEVLAAAGRGDAVAVEGMARLRRYLAAGIGNLVSMYDPEVVVLGGFLRSAFADSLDVLRAEVDDWLMGGDVYHDLRVELAALGDDAARRGGVNLVISTITAPARLTALAG